MFSKTKIPRILRSVTDSHSPATRPTPCPPLCFILFEEWTKKRKKGKERKERRRTTGRQNHKSRRIADWNRCTPINRCNFAISTPSPPTFITRGTRESPYQMGCVVCFTLNRRVVYPSFWLMECGEAGGRIFAKRLIIIRIALPFIHGQRMCVPGRRGVADRSPRIGGSLSLLHTGLISRPIFPTRNFLSEMRIRGISWKILLF